MQVLGPISVAACLIYITYRYKDKILINITIATLFAIVAFSFQPGIDDDLRQEYINLQSIREQGWSYFTMISSNINGYFSSSKFQGLYVAQMYYFLISLLPIKNLHPFIAVFINYFLEMKLLEKISNRFSLRRVDVFWLFLCIICFRETYPMMSGIRNYLAFTIFGYVLYEDLFEKRNRMICFIIYIGLLLFHQSVLALILVRLLVFIPSKRIKWIVSIASLGWGYFISEILEVVMRYTSNPIMNSIYVKIYQYTNANVQGGKFMLSGVGLRYLIFMASNIGIVLLLIYIFLIWQKMYRNDNNFFLKRSDIIASDNMVFYCIEMLCLAIGSLPFTILFSRFFSILHVLSIIPIGYMYAYCNKRELTITKKNITLILLLACLIKFVLIMFFENRSMNFNPFGWYGY